MTQNDIQHLILQLRTEDPVIRQSAREQLVARGGADVVRALVAETVSLDQQTRWEAAKALATIADPVAAPALMHALDDDDRDVQWVAGQGLVAMKGEGLSVVLSGLIRRATSLDFCKAAHHVLHDLRERGFDTDVVTPVLDALDSPEPQVTAPPAALAALQKLNENQ